MSIPKILHFTWKTKELPGFLDRLFTGWKALHPDWEVRLWDDNDIAMLVTNDYPEMGPVFARFPRQIFRVDAFRFLVLHKFGGIYSDLDVVPKRRLDPLTEQSVCFVGVEPEGDARVNNGKYLGMPFCLGNAFMGSEPGHPFWVHCMAHLKDARCDDVVDATGPRYVNAIALTVPRHERPDALMPECWSPLSGTGRPSPTSPDYAPKLLKRFRVIGEGEAPYGSHLWRNSWLSPLAYKGPKFWRIPNVAKWALRQLQNPEMARTAISYPSVDYDDQELKPVEAGSAAVIAVDLSPGGDMPALAMALNELSSGAQIVLLGGTSQQRMALQVLLADGLDVTRKLETGGPAGRNAVLDMVAEGEGYVLFVDGRLSGAPRDALLRLMSSGRPVTTAWLEGPNGEDRNVHAFTASGDLFKYLYRNGARDGAIRDGASGNQRLPFKSFFALTVAPLTAAGPEFLLVDRAVARAGARFAQTPYKYHRDSEGFCLMARDKGFEVCGMPGVKVRLDAGKGLA